MIKKYCSLENCNCKYYEKHNVRNNCESGFCVLLKTPGNSEKMHSAQYAVETLQKQYLTISVIKWICRCGLRFTQSYALPIFSIRLEQFHFQLVWKKIWYTLCCFVQFKRNCVFETSNPTIYDYMMMTTVDQVQLYNHIYLISKNCCFDCADTKA